MSGVANPSEEAIKEAVTKEEMARHCRRRTRGVEATSKLIESLLTTMCTATDALGVPLFRDDMVETIWPEQRRHLPCIQDPPRNPIVHDNWLCNEGWGQASRLKVCSWFNITGKFSSALSMIYSR